MAKSKKSKILAMALCASVMAGIYASPVMAHNVGVDGGNLNVSGSGSDYTINSGSLDLKSEDVAAALDGVNTDINIGTGSITASNFTAGNYNLVDIGNKTQYMYHAATNTTGFRGAVNVEGNVRSSYGNFIIGDGSTALRRGELSLDNIVLSSTKLATINDVITEDGEIVSKGDVTSTTQGGTEYSLNTVGANTAAISREQNANGTYKTVVSDRLYVDDGITQSSGGFWISANGQASFSRGQVGIDYDGNILVGAERDANGVITDQNIKLDATTGDVISKGDVTTLKSDGTVNYSLNTIGENTQHIKHDDNGTHIEEVLNISGSQIDASIGGNSFTLNNSGFTFNGTVNLGNASNVGFDYTGNLGSYTGNSYNLGQLVDTVNDIYDRTQGISYENGTTSIEGNLQADSGNIGGVEINDNRVTADSGNIGGVEMNDNRVTADSGNIGGVEMNDNRVTAGSGNVGGVEMNDNRVTADSGNIGGVEMNDDRVTAGSGNAGGAGSGNIGGVEMNDNRVTAGSGNIGGVEMNDNRVTAGSGNVGGVEMNDNRVTAGSGNIGGVEMNDNRVTAGSGNIGGVEMNDNRVTADSGNIGGVEMNDNRVTADSGNIGGVEMNDNTVTADKGAFKDVTVDNSVTVAGGSENKTTINNDGITVGDKGTSIKNDSISVGDGGYIGGGDVVSGEGVSLNQTAERVGELEDRIDKVGAMAAAIANLRTMGYDPAAPTEVAVGIGQYRDETGAALGLFHYPNRDFMLSLSVSTSGDEVMGGIGATWKFGRKSPEKVAEIKKAQAEADARRAEEAKLAKAEEMKQAAKEAKIKAQQERHAKLAAERAAQAEAAK